MNYAILTTEELMEVVRGGDGQAFDELYNRFWEQCYIFAFRRLKNRDDAKDVVQNVFVTLWHKKDKLTVNVNAEAYLFTMVRNETLRCISRAIKDRRREEEMEQLLQPVLDELLDPYQKEILLKLLSEEVRLLPDRMQQVFRMNMEENLNTTEIAQRLSLSEQTVRNTLNAALKKLRVKMKEAVLLIVMLIEAGQMK
ncbi:RNA polymerase sigma factor [Chitinophaga barathri]|uniref:Sigma-70 family RNA polymerase sigma factor n=1 Tax=Chitinophaga barathri TaxID=1647451 RepID=A0A3N4MJ97_9BACT|nr:sigma-70 family RNA polymerase sigma factor [Chitinophaga barathri]RPD42126.1 sigma-70 family RNA polymerase sigma factor [Chitinophaga barathri]